MKKNNLVLTFFIIYSIIMTGVIIAQISPSIETITIKDIYANKEVSKLNWTSVTVENLTSKEVWKRVSTGALYEARFQGNVLEVGNDYLVLENSKFIIKVNVPYLPHLELFALAPLENKRVEVEGIIISFESGYITAYADSITEIGNATKITMEIAKPKQINVKNLGRYYRLENQTLSDILSTQPQILNFTYLVYAPPGFSVVKGRQYDLEGWVNWYYGLEFYALSIEETKVA